MRSSTRTLAELYAPGRANSLNVVRLLLASLVIVEHAFPVTGSDPVGRVLYAPIGDWAVNGFFAASGFLIWGSWVRTPSPRRFLIARVARIYPAFWVCLAMTAFVFAPVAAALHGKSWMAQLTDPAAPLYVLRNASLAMLQWTIGDSPSGVPYETSWDASLWTLAWEFSCYIMILGLGLCGAARHRWMLPTALGISVLLVLATIGPLSGIEVAERVGRFTLFFLVGAVAYQSRDWIRIGWPSVVVSFVLITVTAMPWMQGLVPLRELIHAPITAVAILGIGGLVSHPRLRLRNDISYGVYIYGFPVQQLLMHAFGSMTVIQNAALAILCTAPLAMCSWFIIEKPAIELGRRIATQVDRSAVVGA